MRQTGQEATLRSHPARTCTFIPNTTFTARLFTRSTSCGVPLPVGARR
ncbi:MAG: hypothetical protein LBG47_02535 [Prevotellaceae bacterium]|nr:hypothetical protein [Prevotellaceae bacterium]